MLRAPAFVAAAALLWTIPSFGFCRATTCEQHCEVDAQTGCVTSGVPLAWSGGCITINVQSAGAPTAGISAEAAEASLRRAVDTWLSVDCDGAPPSIAVEIGQKVSCDAVEYSERQHNANIVLFREGTWPHPTGRDALGATRLQFGLDGGDIWDADIELNAVTEPLATGTPKSNQVDLDSLMTHEVGHLFGLDHTKAEGATMMADYVKGSTDLRTLEPDDIAGICAIYPPQRAISSASCEPRHGFSELCAADQPAVVEPPSDEDDAPSSKSCSLSPARSTPSVVWPGLLGVALLLRRRRR